MSNVARPQHPPDDLFDLESTSRAKVVSPVAGALAAWSGASKPKRSSSGISPSKWRKHVDDVREMMTSAEWDDANALHLVALYAILHEGVYKVVAAELESSPKERLAATGAAARMLKAHFDGDACKMASFIRWVWLREEWREKKRRDEGTTSSFRVGWRLQFNASLFTEWRLDRVRRGEG